VLEKVEGQESGRVPAQRVLVQRSAREVHLKYVFIRRQVRQLLLQVNRHASTHDRAANATLFPTCTMEHMTPLTQESALSEVEGEGTAL
jgi:hypothetical protein